MEEIVLLIYVKDVEYGKRFLRFLAGKKFANLYLELITKKSGINGHRGDNIVVLTDDLEVKEDEKQKVIYLCKEQSRQEKKIYQYQKAEMICRELTEILHLKKRERKEEQREDGGEKNGVYCVFSTEGVGSTLLSVMLSQYLGNYGNCLYIRRYTAI